MTTTTQQAIVKRDEGPGGIVAQYRDDFAQVLPTHIKTDAWMRVTLGALRRDPKVAEAAANNTAALLSALLHAARLGLEPGTEQYYLTPRRVKQQGGSYRNEILGIVGYQGLIELMYRAGAVSSVIVECVYTCDVFRYAPGRDERPVHEIDWDSDDRGDLRLVYAYAVMKDGATSKVVVLNRKDIARIKRSSTGADTSFSPWVTSPDAMWLKSAARQLAKWVPTSAEFMKERLRAVAEVRAEQQPAAVTAPALLAVPDLPAGTRVDALTGEEVLDGEVEEPDVPAWPDVPQPGGGAA